MKNPTLLPLSTDTQAVEYNDTKESSGPNTYSWRSVGSTRSRLAYVLPLLFFVAVLHRVSPYRREEGFRIPATSPESYYTKISEPRDVCPGQGNATSYSGYIGLKGDTEEKPKRSFFWYVIPYMTLILIR